MSNIEIKYAFDNNQLKKVLKDWGLKETDKDKIHFIGGGGYIKKSDLKDYYIMKHAFDDQETGTPFGYDDFIYFQNTMNEMKIDVNESDFDKYFKYYDEAIKKEKKEQL